MPPGVPRGPHRVADRVPRRRGHAPRAGGLGRSPSPFLRPVGEGARRAHGTGRAVARIISPMAAARVILVLGVVASLVAVGLAFGFGALRGAPVTGEEIARDVILSFVVSAIAVLALRRRIPPAS